MAASLETLPVELKTRIAKLCSRADANWEACKEAIKLRQDVHARVFESIENNWSREWRSLDALSRVSTTWREICAPLLFNTVDLRKTRDPIFVLDLAPRIANSITSARWVRFLDKDQSLLSLVDTLQRLPRVASLTLNVPVLRTEFQASSFPPSRDRYPYEGTESHLPRIWRTFDSILARLEELQLDSLGDMRHVCALLPAYRGLRRLSLEGMGLTLKEDGDVLSIGRLSGVLPSLNSLRSLVLDSREQAPLDLSPLVPSDGMSSRYPPLETLRLCAVDLHSSWLSFATLFSQSLLHLSFESTDDDEEHFGAATGPPFDLATAAFPLITKLQISALRFFTSPIILSATRRTFPMLNDLTLGLQFWNHEMVGETGIAEDIRLMKHAKSLLPKRRSIRFFDKYWSFPDESTEQAQELGIETSVVPSFPSEALLEEEDQSENEGSERDKDKVRDDVHIAIKCVIDFLKRALKQAMITDSPTEWKRLANLVREAELERVAMQC